jgi:hypothetical protein
MFNDGTYFVLNRVVERWHDGPLVWELDAIVLGVSFLGKHVCVLAPHGAQRKGVHSLRRSP